MQIQPQADGSYLVPLSPIEASWRTPITDAILVALQKRLPLYVEISNPRPSEEGIVDSSAAFSRILGTNSVRIAARLFSVEKREDWLVGVIKPTGCCGDFLKQRLDGEGTAPTFGFRGLSTVDEEGHQVLHEIITWTSFPGNGDFN